MKTIKGVISTSLFIFITLSLFSQTTLILQPDESTSKDACVWNIIPNTNYGNHTDFIATAWSSSGDLSIIRSLVDFDLSSIPANSNIQSAVLSLNHHSSTNNIGHSQTSGSNACWIKRVTEPWDELTVTWNNQPTTTTIHQVDVPASSNNTESYPNIDVTDIISDIYNNPSSGYGLMIELQTEQYYRSLLFASSGESNAGLRPKLTITYAPDTISNDTCVVFRFGDSKVFDALVWNIFPNTNYVTHPDYIATAWTSGGDFSLIRSMIEFDISSIPPTANITSAELSLYHYPSTNNIGHSQSSGSNESWLRRITTDWDPNTVTWNTQPTYTAINQVYLPASSSNTQNYPNIDVTSLITDIHNNPSTSFGIMIMLETEDYYRSLLFASCDNTDSNKWPALSVCYEIQTSNLIGIGNNENVLFYPNPVDEILNIDYYLKSESNVDILFYSVSGKIVDELNMGFETAGKHSLTYSLNNELYGAGIYFVKIISEKEIYYHRFIKIAE